MRAYQQWVETKKQELIERLAIIGANTARIEFSQALYAGRNDVEITVVFDGNNAEIIASGEAVAFIEFGSGVRYGNGYLGQKPAGTSAIGTYGKGKGSNPNGWVYVGEQGNSGTPVGNKGNVFKTYGNPPAMAMYKTAREIERDVVQIAREVFNS